MLEKMRGPKTKLKKFQEKMQKTSLLTASCSRPQFHWLSILMELLTIERPMVANCLMIQSRWSSILMDLPELMTRKMTQTPSAAQKKILSNMTTARELQ